MSGHITKLTYLRNGGLRVFVDGQALCVIDAADWGAFGLSKGDALSGEIGEALQQCAQRFEARKRAAASLACQAYSAKGLERRLRQKGTPRRRRRRRWSTIAAWDIWKTGFLRRIWRKGCMRPKIMQNGALRRSCAPRAWSSRRCRRCWKRCRPTRRHCGAALKKVQDG